MAKCLASFLFVFLALSTVSYAKNIDAMLKKDFGPDLLQAPFFLRFSFMQKYNKPWEKTDYHERKNFLIKYENDLEAQRAKDNADAKTAAADAKERLAEKRAEKLEEKNRLKAQLAEEKAEKQAEAARQKAFNEAIAEQRKELQQMKLDQQQQEQQDKDN